MPATGPDTLRFVNHRAWFTNPSTLATSADKTSMIEVIGIDMSREVVKF